MRPRYAAPTRKLRQHPAGFGTARIAESRWSDEVADVTLRLLDRLRYRGVSDDEFRCDPRDGKPRFVEMNARRGLVASLATAADVNLVEIA